MISRVSFLSLLLMISSCSVDPKETETNEAEEVLNSTPTEPVYEIITTELLEKGFGYQILKDGKLIIDQQQIPAVQGNQYFSSEDAARRTGELALKKIKDQLFPPTISIEELDSLGVLQNISEMN